MPRQGPLTRAWATPKGSLGATLREGRTAR